MSAGDDNGGRAVFFHGATASEVAPEVDVEEPATTTWLCVTSTIKNGGEICVARWARFSAYKRHGDNRCHCQ